MKFKAGDKVKVGKIWLLDHSRENIMFENVVGVVDNKPKCWDDDEDVLGYERYCVIVDDQAYNCSEDQITLIKEATMKETISLKEAYKAGMCREGLKRFIQILDSDSRFYNKDSVWARQWNITTYLDKLTPEENRWLKDHGYLYKQEHEYKFGDDVEYTVLGKRYNGVYIEKDKNGHHIVYDSKDTDIYKICDERIRPA